MKDWEARFEHSEQKPLKKSLRTLRLFSWTALIIASVYTALVTRLLIGISRDGDPEAQTAGWIVFGLPWILVCGPYHWFAIPLNAVTLYFLVVAILAVSVRAFRAKYF
jgi:hypothetical protein